MEPLVLDGCQTIVLAILVLFFGEFLTSKIPFLRNYKSDKGVEPLFRVNNRFDPI